MRLFGAASEQSSRLIGTLPDTHQLKRIMISSRVHLTSRVMATMVCSLVIVGCANANDSTSGPAGPQPVSQEVYQTELRTAGNVLKAAFGGIETAPPLEPLENQIDSAASNLRTTAQRFAGIVPPPQYAAGQADLVSALAQLADQLAGLSTQVRSRDLCAAPPAMATLGTLAGADALRRASSALGSGGLSLASSLPVSEPLSDRRESNGKILRSPGSGEGHLKVENNTEHDTVMMISESGRAVGSFYVARNETAKLTKIPDGNYEVFYTSGSDWDGGAFTRSCAYRHVEKTLVFKTTPTRGGFTYSIHTLKLRGGAESNTSTVDVPPSSFPK